MKISGETQKGNPEILRKRGKGDNRKIEKQDSRIAEEKKFAVDRTTKVDENKQWTIL